MYVRFCILLVMWWQFCVTLSLHISDVITENSTFYYRILPVSPSVRATIEFRISYLRSSFKETHPVMGIYTAYPKVNIEKHCSYIQYGQFHNGKLHSFLRIGEYETTTCALVGTDTVNCRGRVNVHDYIPRNFYLSFGFPCDRLRTTSLLGLKYNISFTRQSNDTTGCTNYSVQRNTEVCSRFYKEASVPNLVGGEKVKDIVKYLKKSMALEALAFVDGTCYQHIWEVACYTALPKCDTDAHRVMHPCREMCYDLVNGCWKKLKSLLGRMGSEFRYNNHNFYKTYIYSRNIFQEVGCNYLPSVNDSIPCFYKPVTCDSPPDVTNGTRILNATQKDVYQLHDVVQYACVNERFQIKDIDSIKCLHSGEWSHPPPKCVPAKEVKNSWMTFLYIILLVIFGTLLVLLIVYETKCKRKSSPELNVEKIQLDSILTQISDHDVPLLPTKRKQESTLSLNSLPLLRRNREFDAFVLYHFDTSHDFVINTLVPELEETRSLKLKIHSRDFQPGCYIDKNIEDAIESSNNAIILMSSGFTSSRWCADEFIHCYIEHIEDPSFKLFIIMMEAVRDLPDLTPNMKKLFAKQTYLELQDPELFTKLARHLRLEDSCNDNDRD